MSNPTDHPPHDNALLIELEAFMNRAKIIATNTSHKMTREFANHTANVAKSLLTDTTEALKLDKLSH